MFKSNCVTELTLQHVEYQCFGCTLTLYLHLYEYVSLCVAIFLSQYEKWKVTVSNAVRERDYEANSNSKHKYKDHWLALTSLIPRFFMFHWSASHEWNPLFPHQAWRPPTNFITRGQRGKEWSPFGALKPHSSKLAVQHVLTGGGSADRGGALRRAPSFHVVAAHSHEVMRPLHLEKHQTPKLSPCVLVNLIKSFILRQRDHILVSGCRSGANACAWLQVPKLFSVWLTAVSPLML